MRLTCVLVLCISVCCFIANTRGVSPQDVGEADYFIININATPYGYYFPRSRIGIVILKKPINVDLAYIRSPPLRAKHFRCFFHSPMRGTISEPFEYQTLFSSRFADAEFVHCYDKLDEKRSFVLLERADGTPIFVPLESSRWWRNWQMIDDATAVIRRVALVDAGKGVKGCDVKTADGAITPLDEVGRFVEVSGRLLGLSCRKNRSFW